MSYSSINPAWNRMEKGEYGSRVQWEAAYANFLQESSPGLNRNVALKMAALDYGLAHMPVEGAPMRYLIGDRVRVTPESFQHIRNSSRSVQLHPSESYIAKACKMLDRQIEGEITRIFPPGYEVNVTFDDGTVLRMKDDWFELISRAPEASASPSPG